MSTVVVMVTVSSRVERLNAFLRSMAEHEPGRDIFIHIQDPDHRAGEIEVPDSIVHHLMVTPKPLGCHAARVLALRELADLAYDTYVNVDDDVTLIEQTNWQPAIDKAEEPGVGFVLTNWVRHPNLLPKAIERMEDRFYKQVMVYQGGGMAYNEEVAHLMRNLPAVDSRYDDIWPLTAYLEGYQSYRYQGSLAVHQIMGKGGMNTYMRSEPRPLLCWDWIDYKLLPGQPVGSDYSIPMDAQIKQPARELHRKRRAEKGWA